MTMAATMMGTWSGVASPTAVNTESSENTMSMMAICTTITTKLSNTRVAALVGRALQRVVDLQHALDQQEQAAGDQHQVAAGELLAAAP